MTVKFVRVVDDEQISLVADAAHSIWNECYAEILDKGQINYMLENFQSKHAIADSIETEGYQYYLIYSDDDIAGYFAVLPRDSYLFLSKIYLFEHHRGTDVVNKTVRYIAKLATRNNLSAVRLTVNRQNYRAIKAYQKRGFYIYDQKVTDIGDGWVMDDFLMEKKLLL